MWIIIITIFLQGSTTYDLLNWLKVPTNCVIDTSMQNTKRRSVMATDGSTAAWFAGYDGIRLITITILISSILITLFIILHIVWLNVMLFHSSQRVNARV